MPGQALQPLGTIDRVQRLFYALRNLLYALQIKKIRHMVRRKWRRAACLSAPPGQTVGAANKLPSRPQGMRAARV